MKLQQVSISDINEEGITTITMQNTYPLITEIIRKLVKLEESEIKNVAKHIDKRAMISRYNDISGEYYGPVTFKNAIDGIVSKGYMSLDIRYIDKDTNIHKKLHVHSLFKTSFDDSMYSSESNSIGEVIHDDNTIKYDFENINSINKNIKHKGTAYLQYDKETFKLFGYYITDKGVDYRGQIDLKKIIKQ